jgi:hypothetical protein
METFGGVEVSLHTFLTSALDGGEWSVSLCSLVKSPQYPLYRRLGGPQSRSGRCGRTPLIQFVGSSFYWLRYAGKKMETSALSRDEWSASRSVLFASLYCVISCKLSPEIMWALLIRNKRIGGSKCSNWYPRRCCDAQQLSANGMPSSSGLFSYHSPWTVR